MLEIKCCDNCENAKLKGFGQAGNECYCELKHKWKELHEKCEEE